MFSKRTLLFVFVLLAALIACNLPSSAATVVPTNLSTPTTVTPTSLPESPTPTPETQAPGDQPDAPSPTAAVVPTISGATSPPTVEPTPTEPPAGGLAIGEFRIDPPTVERGGQITLWWEVTGATEIHITQLSESTPGDGSGGSYQVLFSVGQNLDPSGSLSLSLSDYYINEANFLLIARNAAGDQVQQIGTAAIACSFISSLTDDCPITQATVQAAYQPFEHGLMVWRANPAKIYVVYDDSTWHEYDDSWVEGETFDVGGNPPAGFYQPEHGFGKVWAAEAGVRDNLGWAIEPEIGYTADVETHKYWFGHYEGVSAHITLPDGRVLHLETPWRID